MTDIKERLAGVYGIHCKQTGKWYVGGSMDIHRRINDHFRELRSDAYLAARCKDYDFRYKGEMGRDYWRFGPDAFEWQLLHRTDDKKEILFAEKQFVYTFDSVRDGYNSQAAGRNRHWQA